MKTVIITAALVLFTSSLFSQGSVGVGTVTPHSSAQLDVSAIGKGILIPRITTSQLGTISSPAKGLLVYDTTANQLLVNMGTELTPVWQTIVAKSGWGLNGNTGTDTAVHFIGTTDNVPLRFRVNNLSFGTFDAGQKNIYLGTAAGKKTTAGNNNVYIGDSSGYNTMGSEESVFIGTKTGYTGGFFGNVFIGHEAGMSTNRGGNVMMGSQAGKVNIGGNAVTSLNTYIGYQVGVKDSFGAANTYIGGRVWINAKTGSENTVVGAFAGSEAEGSNNVFLGVSSGEFNGGSFNTLLGYKSGRGSSGATYQGSFNTFIGNFAGRLIDFGSDNTFLGCSAGVQTINGSNNTFVGDSAGYQNLHGNLNTAIGRFATPSASNLSNSTAIGYRAQVSANNCLVLGSINGVNGATASVNVGIGTTNPLKSLHVVTGGTTGVTPNSAAVIVAERSGTDAYLNILTDVDQSSGIMFGNINNASDGAIVYNSGGNTYDLQFRANNNGTHMTIDSTGRVGIGISVPSYGLHVAHNLGANGFLRGIVVDATSGSTGEAAIAFRNSGAAGTGPKYWIIGLNQSRNLSFNYGTQFVGGNTSMTLDSTGNLGIGTTAPDEKLDVNGNIKMTGEVNRSSTGSANLIPICYGSISNTGAINSGTSNFSVTHSATGQFDIDISGESYSNSNYVTNVTVSNFSSVRIATTSAASGKLIVKIWDGAGTEVNAGFHFVVYKQ